MAIRFRNNRYIVYYRKNGKQREEHFEYEEAAKLRNAQLGYGIRRSYESSGPTVSMVLKAYLENKDFNENSRKHCIIRISVNISPFFGGKPASSLTDADIRRYIKKRRKDGVKNSTIRRELTDLQAALNWAAGIRPPMIPFNPVRGAQKPKADDAVIDPPTLEESRAILEAAPDHLKRFIRLSWFLGVRPGKIELLSLRWENVRWETQSVRVISADKGGPVTRIVPIMHESFCAELESWYNEDKKRGPIIHYRGGPVKSIKKAWWKALKDAGITRRLRPYDLRHRFITSALEQGADIKALAEIVGSSPATLIRHYQHVTRAVHRRTVSLIPDLEEKNSMALYGQIKKE